MSNELSKTLAGGELATLRGSVPTSLEIMLRPEMFAHATQAAKMLSKAEGFVPRHLINKTEACFAVIMQAHDWNLSPLAVAKSTYQTPSGTVGYEGKLIHAILEASGRLVDGGITYEWYGDWSKLTGRWKKTGQQGKEYPVADWKPEDETGLGVVVRARLTGEAAAREFSFDLVQAYPRFSTLWATDPKTQLAYAAVRRFASLVVPHLVMGVPFRGDEETEIGFDRARDVTPVEALRRAMHEAEEEDDITEPDADAGVQTWAVATMDGDQRRCMPGELERVLMEEIEQAPNADALIEWAKANKDAIAAAGGKVEGAIESTRVVVDARELWKSIKRLMDAEKYSEAVRLRRDAAAWLPADMAEKIDTMMQTMESGKSQGAEAGAPRVAGHADKRLV